MPRRRYRRRTRFERHAYTMLAAAALVSWAWTYHPLYLISAVVVAGLGGFVLWRVQAERRQSGRQGWIYHLPAWGNDPLVYVGQTTWPDRRMKQHQGLIGPAASWFAPYVDFTRVLWFGPFPVADLDQIEADHIHTYGPWANRVRCEARRRPMLLRHKSARTAGFIHNGKAAA